MTGHLGDLVAPLVDSQLDHNARDSALVHLAHCPACQFEVATQRRLKAMLGGLGEPELPASAVRRLLGLPGQTSGPAAFTPGGPLGAAGAGAPADARAPSAFGAGMFPASTFPVVRAGGPPASRRPGSSLPLALPGRRAGFVPAAPPSPPVVEPTLAVAGGVLAPAVKAPARFERRWTARTVLGSAAVAVLAIGGGAVFAGGGAAAGRPVPTTTPTMATVAVSRTEPLVLVTPSRLTGASMLMPGPASPRR